MDIKDIQRIFGKPISEFIDKPMSKKPAFSKEQKAIIKSYGYYLGKDKNKLLRKKDGTYYAKIEDAEMDILNCKFFGSNFVEIDTKKLTYIQLDLRTLYFLIDLIEEVEEKLKKPKRKKNVK